MAASHAEAHPPGPGIHAAEPRLAPDAASTSLKAIADNMHEPREAAERRDRAERRVVGAEGRSPGANDG